MNYAVACNFICACTFLDRQYGTERYRPYCVGREQHVHLARAPYLMCSLVRVRKYATVR
ncbi:hypothetical protein VCUG_00638 [Vavraia culicis subsp. floridensis]|uniref:Uncharacterized protein n=1 Tax=Vavraia culicis (isolate floridensis) TaxID=948595 RepID=L2GXC3_VAVCU|nr:uncharacterized protein VCUG_00638 [Vavraia culicis subsp. floridensis]ELA47918.1 hypothetical protein VCUG_00638 [Vavraia culicis subsp. floridensis]